MDRIKILFYSNFLCIPGFTKNLYIFLVKLLFWLNVEHLQGFFGPNVPVDNLEANNVALKYFI